METKNKRRKRRKALVAAWERRRKSIAASVKPEVQRRAGNEQAKFERHIRINAKRSAKAKAKSA